MPGFVLHQDKPPGTVTPTLYDRSSIHSAMVLDVDAIRITGGYILQHIVAR
jgi:hypothetical protein